MMFGRCLIFTAICEGTAFRRDTTAPEMQIDNMDLQYAQADLSFDLSNIESCDKIQEVKNGILANGCGQVRMKENESCDVQCFSGKWSKIVCDCQQSGEVFTGCSHKFEACEEISIVDEITGLKQTMKQIQSEKSMGLHEKFDKDITGIEEQNFSTMTSDNFETEIKKMKKTADIRESITIMKFQNLNRFILKQSEQIKNQQEQMNILLNTINRQKKELQEALLSLEQQLVIESVFLHQNMNAQQSYFNRK